MHWMLCIRLEMSLAMSAEHNPQDVGGKNLGMQHTMHATIHLLVCCAHAQLVVSDINSCHKGGC